MREEGHGRPWGWGLLEDLPDLFVVRVANDPAAELEEGDEVASPLVLGAWGREC